MAAGSKKVIRILFIALAAGAYLFFFTRNNFLQTEQSSQNGKNVPDQRLEFFLLFAILAFILIALIMLGFLFYSRSRKNKLAAISNKLQANLEDHLVRYLFEEISLDELVTLPVIRTALQRRRTRSILLREVLRLHSNFSGAYAERLEAFCNASGLLQGSIKKMESRRWHIVCRGISELAQMNHLASYEAISSYTHSKNPILRREAQIAVLKLKGFAGLRFFENYTHPISEWEQLNFIAILSQSEKTDLPDFAAWLCSSNESLQLLALRFIRELNLVAAVPAIMEQYSFFSETCRLSALQTFSGLQAFDCMNIIIGDYSAASAALRTGILDTIGLLGDSSRLDFLLAEAKQEDYGIRFHAVKAIEAITGDTSLLEKNQAADEEIQRIILHVKDKRIRV